MTPSTTLRLEEVTRAHFEAAIGIRVRPDQEAAVEPVARARWWAC
ncbi:hypothetical protein [Streptomyces sp. MH13]